MEMSIDSLYKESGMEPELLEYAQEPGEHPPHGEVMPERLVFGPQPALEVGSFAQVIEGHADRCEPGVRPPVVNRRVGRITHVFLLIRSGFWNRPAKATLEISRSRAAPAEGPRSHIFLWPTFSPAGDIFHHAEERPQDRRTVVASPDRPQFDLR